MLFDLRECMNLPNTDTIAEDIKGLPASFGKLL
jgi:hypothetical protein